MVLNTVHKLCGLNNCSFLVGNHLPLAVHAGIKCFDFVVLLDQSCVDILQFSKQGKLDLFRLSDLFFLFFYSFLETADINFKFFDSFLYCLFFLFLQCNCCSVELKRMAGNAIEEQCQDGNGGS